MAENWPFLPSQPQTFNNQSQNTWIEFERDFNEYGCFSTIEEAQQFLQSYKKQIESYCAQLQAMKTKSPLCCSQDTIDRQSLVRNDEDMANRFFCKLKYRLCSFMSKYQGIKF
mgnify:CR=1 FL=1